MKSQFWSAALLFVTALFTFLVIACGKDKPVKIKLIIDNDISGFFSIKPSPDGIQPLMEQGGAIVYTVKSYNETTSETGSFAKWHTLSALRQSGELVAVYPNEEPTDNRQVLYELSARSDGTIIFLIGSLADKLMYESLSRPTTVEELNEMRKNRK